jgi:hypothetical protein
VLFKRRWKEDLVERIAMIVIIVGLILYITFWVFYILGYFPQLDRPEKDTSHNRFSLVCKERIL